VVGHVVAGVGEERFEPAVCVEAAEQCVVEVKDVHRARSSWRQGIAGLVVAEEPKGDAHRCPFAWSPQAIEKLMSPRPDRRNA
jgi:hypothetical protein